MPWKALRPGLGSLIYRFVMDYDVRHWAARTGSTLSAVLSWQAMPDKNDRLWAAVPSEGGGQALTTVLLEARRKLPWRQTLMLDYPAGEYATYIEAAGFNPLRTLLWMKLNEDEFVNLS